MNITFPFRHSIKAIFLNFIIFLISACGGGGGGDDDDPVPASPPPAAQTYSIGGAITGLSTGNSVVLRNNGGNALTVSSAGEFTFSAPVASGGAYSVTVATQPAGKTCAIAYGGGTVGNSTVKNVAINCVASSATVDPNGTHTLSATHKPTLVGVVIDGAVANLHYDGPQALDGTTDSTGHFNFLPGASITFKVGDVALPPVTGNFLITPFDFAGSNDINNTTLVNIARFLQSLDSDGDPTNGISIPEQAHTVGSGQSLDFSSPSFESAAAPIVANAIPGRTLVSGSTAIAHVQSTLDNLPKLIPIAGAWTTGTGANMRVAILLENGMYYGIEGNCNGKPGYEYGSFAYSGSTLVLAVSTDANGPTCGLNTGAYPVTISGNSLALNNATWSDVSYDTSGLSGFYVESGFISPDSDLSLLTSTQYAWISFEDGVADEIDIGTYTWGGNSTPSASFTPVASLKSGSQSTQNVQRLENFLIWFDDLNNIAMDVAIRPARYATSLVGTWVLDEGGQIADSDEAFPLIFTADGKFMYLGNDETCSGRLREGGGEIGLYAWDAVTEAISLNISGDSNGLCGIDADASSVTSAGVTGNLLTFNSTGGYGVSIRPSSPTPHASNQNSAAGIWKQSSGTGSLILQINVLQVGSNISGPIMGLLIQAIDSNCPSAGTSYAVESLTAAIDVGGPNEITPLSVSTNYDTPSCGLPTTLGPTYSVVGNTLMINGLGTFIRQ